MSYKPAHARPTAPRRFAAAVALILAAALAGLGLTTVAVSAATAGSLPPYPETTTLNLASPYCVTDDVIMNDPLNSTSPIVDTYGHVGPVQSHETGPVNYTLWYSIDPTSADSWTSGPPPGVMINSMTGEVAAYDSTLASKSNSNWTGTPPSSAGTKTYFVRDHGEDANGAKGTTQYEISVDTTLVNNSLTSTVTYEGNDSNNAGAQLTIGLNPAGTQLTLDAVQASLGIAGSYPVIFTTSSSSGWSITNNVLTGKNASDPEIKAVTTGNGSKNGDFDTVFFTLSGLSTDSDGHFYLNNDPNPCVTGQPDTVTVTDPGSQNTTVGTAVTLDISASTSNGDAITGYSATGLPAGLSINASTGVISGTPTSTGTSTVTVTASDSDESGSAVFTWTVNPAGVIPPPVITSGDYVNPYGNGPDVFRQHFYAGAEIAGWPATQHDPATRFILVPNSHGGNSIEEAPYGVANGLCLSNVLGGWGQPAGSYNVLGVPCNGSVFQGWSQSGSYLRSDVDGRYLSPNGTGAELTTDSSPVPWGGSEYHWVNFSSLPA